MAKTLPREEPETRWVLTTAFSPYRAFWPKRLPFGRRYARRLFPCFSVNSLSGPNLGNSQRGCICDFGSAH